MSTMKWRAEELKVLETRPVWRRRITIAGRSIPISVIALALLAVGVAAATLFAAFIDGAIEVTTAPPADVTFDTQTLVLDGATGSCELGGSPPAGEFRLKFVGANVPLDLCSWSVNVTNNGPADVFIGPVENDDAALVGLVNIINQSACGDIILSSASADIPFTTEIDAGAPPGASVAGASLLITFDIVSIACP